MVYRSPVKVPFQNCAVQKTSYLRVISSNLATIFDSPVLKGRTLRVFDFVRFRPRFFFFFRTIFGQVIDALVNVPEGTSRPKWVQAEAPRIFMAGLMAVDPDLRRRVSSPNERFWLTDRFFGYSFLVKKRCRFSQEAICLSRGRPLQEAICFAGMSILQEVGQFFFCNMSTFEGHLIFFLREANVRGRERFFLAGSRSLSAEFCRRPDFCRREIDIRMREIFAGGRLLQKVDIRRRQIFCWRQLFSREK